MLFWVFMVAYAAALYVGWPMDQQLPNLALVGQPYLFTLADGTYRSSSGNGVNYSATGLPSWLLFDGASRTFSGSPASKDVGQFQITLTGTDLLDKSTISNNYQMLVATGDPITLSSPDVMFTTIAQYGQTNGADGLVVRPGQQFSIKFSKAVFKPSDNIKAFYGRSQDRTPLPNWVNFDSNSLTFSGTVPQVVSSIAPSFAYNFCFIATDNPGFAGAVGLFNLVVGAHLLSTSFDQPIKLNGTLGSQLNQSVPIFSSVFLDLNAISPQNISSVQLQNAPSFVSLSSDYVLTGTYPSSSSNANFTVMVRDVFGNTVNLPYQISSIGSLFTVSSMPDVNSTRGQFFELQLMKSYFTDLNSTIISVTSNSTWLTYESSNMTLVGNTPSNFQEASVNVKAQKASSSDELSFVIRGVDASSKSSSSSSSTTLATSTSSKALHTVAATSTSSSTSQPTESSAVVSSDPHRKNLIIGLSAGLGGAALLACLAALFFCCCKKRDRKDDDDEKRSITPTEPELTGPGFGTTFDLDDHTEIARQLGALNAMKLDEDNDSAISCETHVDSEEEHCDFLDDLGKPTKSWRANDMSDSSAVKKMLLEQNRRSEMSLNTINTEQLFSVRVVDDSNSNRVSRQSLLGDLTKDTSSVNVQRLDSDGNVAEIAQLPSNQAMSTDSLVKIVEESQDSSQNMTQASSVYSLMAKLDQDVLQRDPSFGLEQISLNETFQPVTASNGEVVHWKSQEYPDAPIILKTGELDPASPHKPSLNFSNSTLNSPLDNMRFEEDRGAYKAKLVDFTRKGSLKDSACQPRYDHSAAEGQIFEDEDSLT